MRDPLKEYDISFTGLKAGNHHFFYKIEKKFFDAFKYDEIFGSDVEVTIDLNKKTNMLELHFNATGTVEVACDVSNEPYHQPVENSFDIIVKFGSEYNDDHDELLILPFEEHKLNVAQFIYELIVLAIPKKRVHPGVLDGTLKSEIVDKLKELHPRNHKETDVDPRWSELKKLVTNKKS